MSTRSIVAKRQGDGWKGRYVHSDGYPSGVGAALLRIHRATGDWEKMLQVLVEERYGWSAVDADGTTSRLGHTFNVEGFGVAYSDAEPTDWLDADEDPDGMEWAYVLTQAGVTVLEGLYVSDEWKFVAVVRWDDPEAEKKMEALG